MISSLALLIGRFSSDGAASMTMKGLTKSAYMVLYRRGGGWSVCVCVGGGELEEGGGGSWAAEVDAQQS